MSKFGSKAWEFATPLLLLEFSPDGGLIAPTIFGLLKQLIDDFANVHVYLVCALLDGCGKFLYGEALMSYSYASDSCISHASITVRRVGSNSRNPRTM